MTLEMDIRRLQQNLNEESNYKVQIEGLPTMYITGSGPSQVKAGLRKIVKKPDMIRSIERVTKAEVKKAFRLKAMDKEEDNGDE